MEMKILNIITILMVVHSTSISARIHQPVHHDEYSKDAVINIQHHNATTLQQGTEQQNTAMPTNRNETQHHRHHQQQRQVQRLTAIGSKLPHHVRRRRPNGSRKIARNSTMTTTTTLLQRRNSVYYDVPSFGEDTWRRGAEETTTTTVPVESTILTSRGKNYHKNHDGRHVCTKHKTVQVPVKTTEVYTRPTWRHVSEPCHFNQICTTLKMFQEPAYRDVFRQQTTKQIVYECCPGWEQASKSSTGCTNPLCETKCKNGGTCIKPDTCSCPKGFTGKYCELDINECKVSKPCDQYCYNTAGSFYCKCREGFTLLSDGQSCKKIEGDMNGIETTDLENEVDNDNESMIYRLHKVEKMIASDKVVAKELHKSVETASNMIDSLKMRLNNLERKHIEFATIQNKLRTFEAQSQKLERLVNVLFKCRGNPDPFCS